MRKSKAIKTLRNHFGKLYQAESYNTWLSELAEYCELFFGVKSQTMHHFRNKGFQIPATEAKYQEAVTASKKRENEEYLNSLIDIINTKGLYKEPTTSFLATWKNWQILLALLPIIGIIGSAGYGIRAMQVDREILQLENKYDSVVKASAVLPHGNNIPKSKEDTTQAPRQ